LNFYYFQDKLSENLLLRLGICVGIVMMIQLCMAQPMLRCNSHSPANFEQEEIQTGYALGRNEIILPVVFHVVWSTPEENTPEEFITSQLQVLNDDFNRLNPDIINVPQRFQNDVSSIGIRFCLAQQDPDGNPHPGIIRVETDIPFIGGQKETESNLSLIKNSILGGSDAWDPERFLNVWIGARNDGIAGIATFPTAEEAGTPEDGIELDYTVVGIRNDDTAFNLGRTLTHEIGHYLNLEHPWGSTVSCFNEEGDFVDDTPDQGEVYFGCIENDRRSCGSVDMVNNYMNFLDDGCLWFFTNGQRDRMIDALFRLRFGLISSGICADSQPVPPRPLDVALLRQTPFGYQIDLSFLPQLNYRLELYDMSGRFIWTEDQNGLSTHIINLNSLSTGVYVVRYVADDIQQTTRIFIKN